MAQGDAGSKAAPEQADTPKAPSQPSAASLLARAASMRISDNEAIKTLEQANAAGATAKQAALAANARGEKLFSKPERAELLFSWAQNHYPRHPLPVYNRAKLAAIRGDIAKVRLHLQTVKERGGLKLLRKVGFDPTFALVHDDPQVRSLIR